MAGNTMQPAQSGVTLPQMPLGPLTGFLSGMQIDTANRMNDRIMRDDDLQYLIDQIKQQSDASKLQVQQAQDANSLSAANIVAGQYADGSQKQLSDTGLAAGIAGNQQKTVASKDAIREATAPIVVRMGEYIKAKGGSLDPTNQADLDTWKEFATNMAGHGIKVPAFPDHGDTMQMKQWAENASKYAQANSQSFINTVPYQQAVGQINAQNKGKTDVAEIGAGATENAARIQAGGHVQGAEITAAGGVERANIQAAISRNASNTLDFVLNKARQTGGVKPADVGFLRQLAFDKEWNSSTYDTFRAINFNSADEHTKQVVEQARQLAQQRSEQFLRMEPSYVEASKAYDAGTNNGKSSTTSQAKSEGDKKPIQIKGDEDYNALPSGAEFIDPEGNKRRKP